MERLCFLLVALTLGCKSVDESQFELPNNLLSDSDRISYPSDEAKESLAFGDENASEDDVDSRMSAGHVDKDALVEWAMGLSEDGARRLAKLKGRAFRVTCINGKQVPITADLNPDRLSVEIEDGRVVHASWF